MSILRVHVLRPPGWTDTDILVWITKGLEVVQIDVETVAPITEVPPPVGPPPPDPSPPPVEPPPLPPPPVMNWWETLAVGTHLRVTRFGGAPVYYDPPSEKEGAVERERKPQGDTSMTVYRGDDGKVAHGTYIMVYKWPPYNLWVSKFDVEVV